MASPTGTPEGTFTKEGRFGFDPSAVIVPSKEGRFGSRVILVNAPACHAYLRGKVGTLVRVS